MGGTEQEGTEVQESPTLVIHSSKDGTTFQ